MSGRHLYFGLDYRLEMEGEKLVATPVSMRNVDLPISQGELFKGMVDLATVRKKSVGDADTLWFPPATCEEISEWDPRWIMRWPMWWFAKKWWSLMVLHRALRKWQNAVNRCRSMQIYLRSIV